MDAVNVQVPRRPWAPSWRWKAACWACALGAIVLLFLPAFQAARTPSLSTLTSSNLKQLVLASLNHEIEHGSLPRPYTTDSDGRRLHSWRSLLLRYLECPDLAEAIDWNQPWNTETNAALLKDGPFELYQSPRVYDRSHDRPTAHYLAIVDELTIWSPMQAVQTRDIADGADKTIALIEVAGQSVEAFEPRDLTFDEAIDVLVGKADESYEYVVPGSLWSCRVRCSGLHAYRCVAFADGHTVNIGRLRNREIAKALLTRAGGEELTEEEILGGTPLPPSKHEVVSRSPYWGRIGVTLVVLGVITRRFLVAVRRLVDAA